MRNFNDMISFFEISLLLLLLFMNTSSKVSLLEDLPDKSFKNKEFTFGLPVSDFSSDLKFSPITLTIEKGNLPVVDYVDVSTTTKTTQMSKIASSCQNPNSFFIESNFGYLLCENYFGILLMNDSLPKIVGSLEVNGFYRGFIDRVGMESGEESFYIVGQIQGFWIIDITNKAHPKVKKKNDTLSVCNLAVQYPYAYFLIQRNDKSILQAIDLVEEVVNSEISLLFNPRKIFLPKEGSRIYVSNDKGIFIIDKMTPLTILSNFQIPLDHTVVDFFIQKKKLVIGIILTIDQKTKTNSNLMSVDFSDYTNPKTMGTALLRYTPKEKPLSLKIIGSYASVGFSKFIRFIDLSNLYEMEICKKIIYVSYFSEVNFLDTKNNDLYSLQSDVLAIVEFKSFLVSGGPHTYCGRAFTVDVFACDDSSFLLDLYSTCLITSFILNFDCSSGPSILTPLPSLINKSIDQPFSFRIQHDQYFYSSSSAISVGIDVQSTSDWIGETIGSTLFDSFSSSCVNANTKKIFIRKSDHVIFLAQQVCVSYVQFDPKEGAFGFGEQDNLLMNVKALVADEEYLYVVRNLPYVTVFSFSVKPPVPPKKVEIFGGLKIQDIVVTEYQDQTNMKKKLYICQDSTFCGLKIYDITNITNYTFDAEFSYSINCMNLFTSSKHPGFLFIQERHIILIVDVSDSKNPKKASKIETTTEVVEVSGDFLFLTYNTIEKTQKLDIYNISNPFKPKYISSFPLKWLVNSMAIRENQIFLGLEYSLSQSGVQVIDISNKLFPVQIGLLGTKPNLNDIAIDGDFLFLGCGNSEPLQALKINSIYLSGTPENCNPGEITFIAADSTGERKEVTKVELFGCSSPPEKKHSGGGNESWWSSNSWIFPVIGGGSFSLIFFVIICCCCCIVFLICFVLVVLLFLSCCFFLGRKKGDSDQYLFLGNESINDGDSNRASLNINKDLFEIDFKKIKLLEVITSGGGGAIIYRAKWMGKIVCVKMFKKKSLFVQNEDLSAFEREMSVMGSISHPNILRWYGSTLKYPMIGKYFFYLPKNCSSDFVISKKKKGIVMDYCENGDLHDCMVEKKIESFDDSIRIIREICSGMAYLHDRNIIHRDLKPQNVLLDSNLVVKIMDFGLSRSINDKDSMTQKIGTSVFMAPELLTSTSYSFPVDVFAFSILVYIVLSKNTKPYGESGGFRCEWKVANNPSFRPVMSSDEERNVIENGYEWILKIMKAGWNHDASERPSFSKIEEMFESTSSTSDENEEEAKDLDEFIVEEES